MGCSRPAGREHPDVIVLDVELDDGDGLEALRAIREEGVAAGVLVLTDRTDGASVLDALKLGVRGYLGKADGLRAVGDCGSTGRRRRAPDRPRAGAGGRHGPGQLRQAGPRGLRDGGIAHASGAARSW